MPIWIWIFIILTAVLFGLKMTYVFCTALVMPITQGALYVSTSRVRIAAIIDAVSMKPGQLLVDLGCGDGRVLRRARKYYSVKAIGYEVNLLAYLKAKLLCIGSKDVIIKRKNFWSADLSDANVVFCYLYPDVMQKLSRKLKADLKAGTMIVSCNFGIPGFKLNRVLRPAGALHSDPLYVYRV
ncbi:MAG: hypothetical protein HKO68_00295 [Desulfobacterales bacterium]|nr:hypothetical protein [Desulfobacterales bacterium]